MSTYIKLVCIQIMNIYNIENLAYVCHILLKNYWSTKLRIICFKASSYFEDGQLVITDAYNVMHANIYVQSNFPYPGSVGPKIVHKI